VAAQEPRRGSGEGDSAPAPVPIRRAILSGVANREKVDLHGDLVSLSVVRSSIHETHAIVAHPQLGVNENAGSREFREPASP